jgi:hypothetical protein
MLTNCRFKSRGPRFGYFIRTIVICLPVCASIMHGGLNGWTAISDIDTQTAKARLVNRAQKGDRLVPTHPTDGRPEDPQMIAPRAAPAGSGLPDGCEPAVSPLANGQLARLPGRCVS